MGKEKKWKRTNGILRQFGFAYFINLYQGRVYFRVSVFIPVRVVVEKGYTRFVGKNVTGRRKRLRLHKVYTYIHIFLIRITSRVDLAMSVGPSFRMNAEISETIRARLFTFLIRITSRVDLVMSVCRMNALISQTIGAWGFWVRFLSFLRSTRLLREYFFRFRKLCYTTFYIMVTLTDQRSIILSLIPYFWQW